MRPPSTPDSRVQDGSKEQTERIHRLVEDVRGTLALLDDVFGPSFGRVLFGFTDRLFQRAEDVLDILIGTVEALERLDPTAVSIKANIIADDRGQKQLIGLARYVVSIGWSISVAGILLIVAAALFGTTFLTDPILDEMPSLDPMIAPPLLLSGLALWGRGFVLVLNGQRQLRMAPMKGTSIASSSGV